jgi:hypothetical protein
MSRLRSLFSMKVDLLPLGRWVWRHPSEVILACGAMLRLGEYFSGRSYWLDEGSLLANLARPTLLTESGHLSGDQLAPLGFLMVQRMAVQGMGESPYVTRFLPLVCGLVSLWLFQCLVRRWQTGLPALAALALFSFSDDLIYYSSELKPYASDLCYGLGVLLLAATLDRPINRRSATGLAAVAVAAPWFSFPSAFLVAGCGVALICDRAINRSWNDVLSLGAIAVAWFLSFATAHRVSRSLLHPATTMYIFWDFAFLPLPPRSWDDARAAAAQFLEVFVNPLNVTPPYLGGVGVVVPLTLVVFGLVRLTRRDPLVLAMLALPIVLAAVASAMRRYPFHGRLLLPLVPAFYLLMAEGTALAERHTRRAVHLALIAAVLAYPCLTAISHVAANRFRDFNSHGDLHRNLFID